MSAAEVERKKRGIVQCYWCKRPFSNKRKASYDHVNPRGSGLPRHARVLSCNACNWCRGDMPFEDYATLSRNEHQAARRENRPYVPPRAANRPEKYNPKRYRSRIPLVEVGDRVVTSLYWENSQSPSKRRKFIIRVALKAMHLSKSGGYGDTEDVNL